MQESKAHGDASRVDDLDVFRGVTLIFMILANTRQAESYEWLTHATWDGWTLTDLVFPVHVISFKLSFLFGSWDTRLEWLDCRKPTNRPISRIYSGNPSKCSSWEFY